ncbi:MAG: hypothetical protein P8Z70_02640, partial [Desulfuromonadales bacterium]
DDVFFFSFKAYNRFIPLSNKGKSAVTRSTCEANFNRRGTPRDRLCFRPKDQIPTSGSISERLSPGLKGSKNTVCKYLFYMARIAIKLPKGGAQTEIFLMI